MIANLKRDNYRTITCLSMSQPFAELAVSGKKTIELRTWNTSFRGTFFIHSPIRVSKHDCMRLQMDCNALVTGSIVGSAKISDVIRYDLKKQLKNDLHRHFSDKTYAKNPYGFVLDGAKRLRVPIPYKGMLGFFKATITEPSISIKDIKSELMDEEFRYRWIGHH